MTKDTSIFKEYDIRGVYPKEINEKTMAEIASGIIVALNLKSGDKITVSRDKRPSSPKLATALIDAFLNNGVDVVDIGIVTTPMFYFGVSFLETKGGAMITASHNPLNNNGVKITREMASPVSGKEVLKAITEISDNQLGTTRAKLVKKKKDEQKGHYAKKDISDNYNKKVFEDFKMPVKSKITPSFDYDGDRLMIKIKDKEISGDIVGAMIGEFIAKKGDTVIYDLRCSRAIPRLFRNKGVIAIPCKVGGFNIIKAMQERQAVFGMELTGHYYFKKFNYREAPPYAICILSERIDKNKENLEDITKPFSGLFHSGIISMNLETSDFEKIKIALKEAYRNGAHNTLDGLTIECSNWWMNIRKSNTENLVRFVVEANSEKLLKEKVEEISGIIKM